MQLPLILLLILKPFLKSKPIKLSGKIDNIKILLNFLSVKIVKDKINLEGENR